MKNNLAKEALKRSLLLMGYDTSKTLTENEVKTKRLLNEGELDQMKALLSKCLGNVGEPALTGQEQEQIAGDIWTAFKGVGTKNDLFEKAINQMNVKGNHADLCAISANYKDMSGEDLADGIDGDVGGMLGFGGELMSKAHSVFRQMAKRSQDTLVVKGQEGQDINAFNKKFPCIFATAKVSCVTFTCGPVEKTSTNYNFIKVKDEDGKVYQMHLNGDLYDDSTGDFSGYHMTCQSGKPSPVQGSAGMNESISKKKLLGEWKLPDGKKPINTKVVNNMVDGQSSQYNRAVADTQQKLYNLGFYIGNSGPAGNGVDGISGQKTKGAESAWKNGDTCEVYNKKMNYPNPATCKSAETPKAAVADKEITVSDPSED